MNIQKTKYNSVLDSVVAVGYDTAGDIKNAAITIVVASLFKYKELTKDEFRNGIIDIETLSPVRTLINKINELHPINVTTVVNNATALIIKTARSTFGCPYAIAYSYNEFAQMLASEQNSDEKWHILNNSALIEAVKYADELISAMETTDTIEVSNEGCNCVGVEY